MTKKFWKWQGHIVEVYDNTFWLVLEDETDTSLPDEIVEIEIKNISDRYKKYITVGQYVLFFVRYYREDYCGGKWTIRFLKPLWKEGDICL